MRSGDRESIHAVNLVKEVFELRIKNVESDLQQTLAAHNQRINRIITIAFGVMSACIGIAALLLPIH
jgi:hypothetical protein